jgi:membrane glycosyltransferase
MKIASLIARYLLGLVFVVFGLNGFLQFIPQGPMPTGVPGQFLGALMVSHYMVPVFAFQLIGGILLLINRYVPLGLTILAPVIVNILMVHILLVPSGLPLAFIVLILWILVFISVRPAFDGILQK